MSVYIKGMEMPTEGFVEILIRDDGTVLQTGQSYRIDENDYYTPFVGEIPAIYTAVPVPEHGRLGDLDALHKLFLDKGKEYKGVGGAMLGAAAWCIANAPTIIPAEEGE